MNEEQIDKKIQKLVKEGKLLLWDDIFNSLSKDEQERIKKRSQEIMAAMELRRLRKKLKLSQNKLAEKMKVKRETITRIESGQQNVTLATLYRIAAATNTTFHFEFR